MIPLPIVRGLVLCEKAIVEDGSKNVSLINTFTKIWVRDFPSTVQPFIAYAALTDGLGEAIMDLVVTRLETDEVIYSYRNRLRFPDRLEEVRALIRVNNCTFPAAGQYEVTLLIDGEWVAQRDLKVAERGATQ